VSIAAQAAARINSFFMFSPLVRSPAASSAGRCRIVYRIRPIDQGESLPEDDHLERDERLRAGGEGRGHDEGEEGEMPLHVRSEGSKDGDAILVIETKRFKRG
jgi:hypothetical protein